MNKTQDEGNWENDFVHHPAAKHPAFPRLTAHPNCSLCDTRLDQKRFASPVKTSLGL